MPRKKLTPEEAKKRKKANQNRYYAKKRLDKEFVDKKNARQRKSYHKDLEKNRKKNRDGMARRTKPSNYELFLLLSKRDSNSNVPCCACKGCNEKTFDFLSIDHINGVSDKWPRDLRGARLSYQILNAYKKTGILDEGFRVLCQNCNHWSGERDNVKKYGKGDILKYCPHNKKKSKPTS